MEEAQETRYWCHNCEEVIVPVEPEKKCPDCDGGFVEEMGSEGFEPSTNIRSDRNLSLWAPLLLGMMGGSSRRSRTRRVMMDSSSDEEGRQERIRRAMRDTDDEDEDDDDDDDDDSDRELEDLIRRRRRRGTSLVRLLQTLRDDLRGLDDIGRDRDRGQEALRERRERERARRDRERERERTRERDRGRERTESVILINSHNEAIILQGTFGPNDNQERSSNTSAGISLGDYFFGGSGLDLLLQRLADSDLNRSGTPPAKKESVEALPTVNIQEILGCTVCLEEFEMGTEAKEMPCQHKFHSHCILPWLELHSSCPVCRFQLPTEESKNPCESGSGGGTVSADGDDAESSSSDVEGSDHNGDSQPGSPIFPENFTGSDVRSALDALFPNQSLSSWSDENIPHSSES